MPIRRDSIMRQCDEERSSHRSRQSRLHSQCWESPCSIGSVLAVCVPGHRALVLTIAFWFVIRQYRGKRSVQGPSYNEFLKSASHSAPWFLSPFVHLGASSDSTLSGCPRARLVGGGLPWSCVTSSHSLTWSGDAKSNCHWRNEYQSGGGDFQLGGYGYSVFHFVLRAFLWLRMQPMEPEHFWRAPSLPICCFERRRRPKEDLQYRTRRPKPVPLIRLGPTTQIPPCRAASPERSRR